MPVGAVLLWGAGVVPGGYLPCDGRSLERGTYGVLFGVIGIVFGDGAAPRLTFALPDLRGRFALSVTSAEPVATQGGSAADTLTVAQMPAHSHTVVDAGHKHSTSDLINRSDWKPSLIDGNFGNTPKSRDTATPFPHSTLFSR
jgi:microcystin-dependent protein